MVGILSPGIHSVPRKPLGGILQSVSIFDDNLYQLFANQALRLLNAHF